MINGQKMIKKINFLFALLTVLSITLIPSFTISENLPAFQLLDILLPFLVVLIYVQRAELVVHKIYKYLFLFSFYILFTIFWNGRMAEIRDYFEIYKIFKFTCVILFFSTIDISNFYKKILYPIFGMLVVFNIFHYFNWFNFNYVLEHFYNGGIHIQTFGLNSIGGEATRRMIGTIGNPNNNAILFLVLAMLFLPRQKQDLFRLGIFFLAISMFFLCQSRTGLIALFAMIMVYMIIAIRKKELKLLNKYSLFNLGIIITSYTIAHLFSVNAVSANPYYSDVVLNGQAMENGGMTPSYLNSIFSSSVYQSNSVQGRLIIWKHLWEMIQLKPLFGYGPYKEYFYENELYAESEYVLMTWRYGFLGLIAYFGFYGFLVYESIKNIKSKYGLTMLLVTVIYSIAALTNNPLMNKDLFILIAIVLGLFYNKSNLLENG